MKEVVFGKFPAQLVKQCKNGNLFKAIKPQGSFTTILSPNVLYQGFCTKVTQTI